MDNAELGNIGSFYAELNIVFDFEAQLDKINDQLQVFSRRIMPVRVPVILENSPLNAAIYDSAAFSSSRLGAFEAVSSRAGKPMSEAQLEAQQTKTMLSQGYSQGDGGWYKAGAEGISAASLMGRGMLGFAGSMAAFTGAFAVIGDLFSGAKLQQQFAILQKIIPSQEQYNQVLSQLTLTSDQTGAGIDSSVHSFVGFLSAAQTAGITVKDATNSFTALSTAIAGTGSQSQSYRIFADFVHMVLDTSKISFAQLQKNDLKYFNIPKLLEQVPMFKGESEDQIQENLNKMSTSQRASIISNALQNRFEPQAAAAVDTVAGRFTILHNQLKILGETLTTVVTPPLKIGIDLITAFFGGLTEGLQDTIWLGSKIKGIGGEAISSIEGMKKDYHLSDLGLLKHLFIGGSSTSNVSSVSQPQKIHVVIKDQTSGGVKTSVHLPSSNAGSTFARAQ